MACRFRPSIGPIRIPRVTGRAGGRAIRQISSKPARVGDVKHSLADITEARQRLGYRGAITFTEGLKRTAAWYAGQR